jgi:TolA-binding protein
LLSQLDQAAFEFKTLLDKYPSSTKSADALLKLGIIHAHTGKTEQAKSEFLKVQQHYPGTTAAQLAKHQLSNLAPR